MNGSACRGRLLIAALLFACAARAQSMISYRSPEDVASAEAAQSAETNLIGPGISGKYTDAHGYGFPYRIYPPPNALPNTTYPLYVYWEIAGPPRLALPSSQAKFPLYVVLVDCGVTQGAGGVNRQWKTLSADALKAVADLVLAKFGNIDRKRIYTGGFSKAGGAAWQAVMTYPDFFAAIVPSSASIPNLAAAPLIVSSKVAVWMFQGGPSDEVTASTASAPHTFAALTGAGGSPRYTQYLKLGHHESWRSDSLTNPQWNDFTAVRQWLFAQHRP